MRLQRFLADAGVASRRRCEEMILEGRVLVNDQLIEALPAFVDPESDVIVVDGSRVRAQPNEYFLIHKPKGVVCTNRDPAGRPRAIDLLPPNIPRLFVVGRLDVDSSGLLLATNDGELATMVMHPRYGVPKLYHVEVRGQVENDLPAKLRKGVWLAETGRAQASEVRVLHRARSESVLLVTLREGRNREVRRMFARFGYPVRKLKRIQIGPLTIKGLPLGACRRLTARELELLRREVRPDAQKTEFLGRPRKRVGARSTSERPEPSAAAASSRPRATNNPRATKNPRKPARPASGPPKRGRSADRRDGPPRRRIIE